MKSRCKKCRSVLKKISKFNLKFFPPEDKFVLISDSYAWFSKFKLFSVHIFCEWEEEKTVWEREREREREKRGEQRSWKDFGLVWVGCCSHDDQPQHCWCYCVGDRSTRFSEGEATKRFCLSQTVWLVQLYWNTLIVFINFVKLCLRKWIIIWETSKMIFFLFPILSCAVEVALNIHILFKNNQHVRIRRFDIIIVICSTFFNLQFKVYYK